MAERDENLRALVPLEDDAQTALGLAGQVANAFARADLLDRYKQELSPQSRRRQRADVALFARYLAEAERAMHQEGHMGEAEPGVHEDAELADDLSHWSEITYGLVVGFQEWQKKQGYSIGSINVRMSTVRTYCRLAQQARYLANEEFVAIASIRKIQPKTGRNIDLLRSERNISTRIGKKKAAPNFLPPLLCRKLKDHLRVSDDPLAQRDLLLVCLLADMGLRCGEVAGLPATCFNLEQKRMTFYRPKSHKTQTHYLTRDTLAAARAYLGQVHPTPDARRHLFQGDRREERERADGSTRPGKTRDGYDDTSINARIRVLGQRYLGIDNLSPHDLRHSWATEQGKKKNLQALQEAGGWSSLSMPLYYIQAQAVANEGLVDPDADEG